MVPASSIEFLGSPEGPVAFPGFHCISALDATNSTLESFFTTTRSGFLQAMPAIGQSCTKVRSCIWRSFSGSTLYSQASM